jgi:hypothetical protein
MTRNRSHLDQIRDVTPSSWGCEDCLAMGRRDWVHLRVCQACGHVGCCDNSPGSAVIERLQADGFQVIAPQFPLTALADDVARLRQVLEFQDGPTIVVGHSYGGQIMTSQEVGQHQQRSHKRECKLR